jgi:hypothetical protein
MHSKESVRARRSNTLRMDLRGKKAGRVRIDAKTIDKIICVILTAGEKRERAV